MPLITLWTTVSALVGGMLAADLVLGITPSYFINNLPRAVMVSNLWLATGKTAVFGLLIALLNLGLAHLHAGIAALLPR